MTLLASSSCFCFMIVASSLPISSPWRVVCSQFRLISHHSFAWWLFRSIVMVFFFFFRFRLIFFISRTLIHTACPFANHFCFGRFKFIDITFSEPFCMFSSHLTFRHYKCVCERAYNRASIYSFFFTDKRIHLLYRYFSFYRVVYGLRFWSSQEFPDFEYMY